MSTGSDCVCILGNHILPRQVCLVSTRTKEKEPLMVFILTRPVQMYWGLGKDVPIVFILVLVL